MLSQDSTSGPGNDSGGVSGSGNGNSSPSLTSKQADDLSGVSYEARSTKDLAWHDVASFLNYRYTNAGKLEVRVRFAGFGKEEDEWVDVTEGVRDRSIPLEPSECHKVNDGDSVLCFRQKDDYALYYDAHVVKVLRRLHGPTECSCVFTVRYAHDKTEEEVSWNRLCRRPSHEVHKEHEEEEHIEDEAPSPDHLKNLW